MDKLFNEKNRRITISLIVIAVAILVLVIIQEITPKDATPPLTTDQAQLSKLQARDEAEINVVKTSLNLYYVLEQKYPTSFEALLNYIKLDAQKNFSVDAVSSLEQSRNDLRNFKYEVKGDRTAYRVKFVDSRGDDRVIDVNYKEDYY